MNKWNPYRSYTSEENPMGNDFRNAMSVKVERLARRCEFGEWAGTQLARDCARAYLDNDGPAMVAAPNGKAILMMDGAPSVRRVSIPGATTEWPDGSTYDYVHVTCNGLPSIDNKEGTVWHASLRGALSARPLAGGIAITVPGHGLITGNAAQVAGKLADLFR